MIIGKEDSEKENRSNILEITSIWGGGGIYEKNSSDIWAIEHC